MLDEKSREYRSLANSTVPAKSANDAGKNHKKKFGSFMGNLLLQNNSKVKKLSPIVQREKVLKQQILTEEPLAALFRMRKNRNEKFVGSGDKGKQSNRAIAFSLKPVPLLEKDQCTKITVNSEYSEHVNTTTEQRTESKITALEQEEPSQSGINLNTKIVLDETNSDNESFADSLQSDDDVLGPWLELGMINQLELDRFGCNTNAVVETIEECQDCINTTSTRHPLELVTVCTSCTTKWESLSVNIIDKLKDRTRKTNLKGKSQGRKKKVRFDDDAIFQENQKIEKGILPLPKEPPNANKKSVTKIKKRSKVLKVVIPPTKSHHSLKTNQKMASKNKANITIEEVPSKLNSESHFTTGAFMTRKTAKVLADPCNGFYPNPYGFAYQKNVEVLNINGHWYRGSLQLMDKGKVKVKYSDWDEQEEWIIMGSKRLRLLSPEEEHTVEVAENNSVENFIDVEQIEDKGMVLKF